MSEQESGQVSGQVSEEEKKAIESLGKDLKENIQEDNKIDNYKYVSNLYSNGDIEVVLNLIDKLQKVIDLMAEHISKYGKVCTFNYGATRPEQWIEYYTKKADEENDNRDTD